MSKKAKKSCFDLKWVQKDEDIPYMTRRLPYCAVCKSVGVFKTATRMNEDIPVCLAHYVEETIDLENLTLVIDDI